MALTSKQAFSLRQRQAGLASARKRKAQGYPNLVKAYVAALRKLNYDCILIRLNDLGDSAEKSSALDSTDD